MIINYSRDTISPFCNFFKKNQLIRLIDPYVLFSFFTTFNVHIRLPSAIS